LTRKGAVVGPDADYIVVLAVSRSLEVLTPGHENIPKPGICIVRQTIVYMTPERALQRAHLARKLYGRL
jgi:hypothetical protein